MAQNVVLNINLNTQQALGGIGKLNNGLSTTLKTINDLEEASAALTEQLKNTERGTQAFKDLSSQLNVVNTELKNAELNMEVLDNEQMVGSVKGLAGGLTDVAGGLALIGVSGAGVEKIAQTFAQVEGLSKVVGGALDVYNEGMKLVRQLVVKATAAQAALTASKTKDTVATGANTVATNAQSNASVVATIKMKALNAVMKANPVFLLITGVGLLVGAMTLLSSAMDDSKKSTEDLNAEYDKLASKIDKVSNAANREIEGRVNDAKQALDLAKARGASETEVYNLTIALYKEEEQARKTRMSDIKGDIADLRKERSKNIAAENYELVKQINSEIAAKREQYRDLEAAEGDFNNKVQILNAETNTNRVEKNKAASEKIVDDRKSHLEKLKGLAKQLADEEELSLAKSEEEKLTIIYNRQKAEIESENKLAGDTKQSRAIMNQALLDLEEKLKNDINDIVTKREQEKIKIQEDAIAEAKRLSNEQKNDEIKLVEEGLDKANDFGKSARQLELQEIGDYYNERIEIAGKLYGEESEEYIKLKLARASEEEKINREWNNKEKLERVQKAQDIANEIANVVQQTTNLISQMLDSRNKLEEYYRNERYSAEEESLKNSLSNRLISQEEYDAEVELLNQRKRQEERKAAMKAFNQKKAIDINNATIAGASATLAAYASGAAYPFVGPATGAIFAGIAGAFAATQIGIIASQKFTAARGGVVPGNGPSNLDSVNALLAPGEMVINSNSSRMFAPILSEINQAGGGVSLAPQTPSTGGMSSSSAISNSRGENIHVTVGIDEITDKQNRINRYQRKKEF